MDKDITLKLATMEDADILLEWRNDPKTKEASYNMEDIKKENHLIWLSKIINDPSRTLFIAWKKIGEAKIAVGTVRADYDKTNDAYELSWTVAPDARRKGIGKKIVATIANILSDRNIKAKIKQGNFASKAIAKYAGMIFRYNDNGILHYFRAGNQ